MCGLNVRIVWQQLWYVAHGLCQHRRLPSSLQQKAVPAMRVTVYGVGGESFKGHPYISI